MRIYIFPILLILAACSEPADSPEKDLPKEDKTEVEKANEELTAGPVAIENDMPKSVMTQESSVSGEYDDLDWQEYEASLTKDFSFVIIISTKDYDEALKKAKDASSKLGYPLNLRGLHPNDEMGLSLPEEVCDDICGGGMVEYPQYLPRNDWGESKYVSVEYSNGFKGFTKGYYIVVVASGEKGDPIIKEAVNESHKFYKDAYAKTCGVWMGCGC
ncbi:MAG: hypothetical protein HRT57_00945 [Crocinitomicaceae bacterium]|nr:hypothetical protein [Crocinitomicaceae bacterium]